MLRAKISRVLLFSVGILFLEFSTSPCDQITVFEVDFESLTSGLVQAFFGFIVLEGVASVGILLALEDMRALSKEVGHELVKINNNASSPPVDQPWQQHVPKKLDSVLVTLEKFFVYYHYVLPIVVGFAALLFSIPDMVAFIKSLNLKPWNGEGFIC